MQALGERQMARASRKRGRIMTLTIIDYGGASRQIECESFEFRGSYATNWIEVRKADGNKELIHNICVIKARAESEEENE